MPEADPMPEAGAALLAVGGNENKSVFGLIVLKIIINPVKYCGAVAPSALFNRVNRFMSENLETIERTLVLLKPDAEREIHIWFSGEEIYSYQTVHEAHTF